MRKDTAQNKACPWYKGEESPLKTSPTHGLDSTHNSLKYGICSLSSVRPSVRQSAHLDFIQELFLYYYDARERGERPKEVEEEKATLTADRKAAKKEMSSKSSY